MGELEGLEVVVGDCEVQDVRVHDAAERRGAGKGVEEVREAV